VLNLIASCGELALIEFLNV